MNLTDKQQQLLSSKNFNRDTLLKLGILVIVLPAVHKYEEKLSLRYGFIFKRHQIKLMKDYSIEELLVHDFFINGVPDDFFL